jgi:predicted nucleotidyltransferase
MPDELVSKILKELKRGLKLLYSDQLKGVFLFGSYARGEQDPESDFDVLIVLGNFELHSTEIKRTSKLVSELSLEYDVSISRKFVNETHWRIGDTALLRNVRAEAIAA